MAQPPRIRGSGPGHSGVGGAVEVFSTGFRKSPYVDVKPAGTGVGTPRGRGAPRKLWHSSPGSSGG